jgi:hypothetical protein
MVEEYRPSEKSTQECSENVKLSVDAMSGLNNDKLISVLLAQFLENIMASFMQASVIPDLQVIYFTHDMKFHLIP